MDASSRALAVRRFLVQRPLASFLIAVILILGTAGSWQQIAERENERVTLSTWLFLGLMVAYPVWNLLLLLRAVRPDSRVFVRWASAFGPHVFGQVALTTGSPLFVLWIGGAVSVALAAWASISASKEPLDPA